MTDPTFSKAERDTEASPKDYVSYLLSQEEPRPPITWSNWWTEIYWGQGIALVIVMPLCTFVAAYYTPLRTQTAIWMMVYYFMSAMSECFWLGHQ